MQDPIESLIVLVSYFLFDPNGKDALFLLVAASYLVFVLFFYFSSDSESLEE